MLLTIGKRSSAGVEQCMVWPISLLISVKTAIDNDVVGVTCIFDVIIKNCLGSDGHFPARFFLQPVAKSHPKASQLQRQALAIWCHPGR